MKTIELFSGTKSFSKVAKEWGFETLTFDNEVHLEPERLVDIMVVDTLPDCDILWASPPCTTFSVSSISHYWKDGKPKNEKALYGIAMLEQTIKLIKKTNPKYWFIENPRGMMRKVIDELFAKHGIKNYTRHTVSYCQYGAEIMKPTDIWTNCLWTSKPICKAGAPCHQSQPRSYQAKLKAGVLKKGTQGMKNATARGAIPPTLFIEIFNQIAAVKTNT